MKIKIMLILSLAAFLSAFGGQSRAGDKKAQEPAAAVPTTDVQVATVIEKEVPVYQDCVAAMDGLANATILAQVQEYLVKQNYTEGSFVKKGTLLFEIDPRPFQASLDVAKATLERILPLAVARAVSQKDKDDAIGRVQSSEAQVLASKAEVRKGRAPKKFSACGG